MTKKELKELVNKLENLLELERQPSVLCRKQSKRFYELKSRINYHNKRLKNIQNR